MPPFDPPIYIYIYPPMSDSDSETLVIKVPTIFGMFY